MKGKMIMNRTRTVANKVLDMIGIVLSIIGIILVIYAVRTVYRQNATKDVSYTVQGTTTDDTQWDVKIEGVAKKYA